MSGRPGRSGPAIVAMSVPASRRNMAQVCRRTCGVIVFSFNDGQRLAAAVAYLATRASTASVLSGDPRLLGKSASSGAPARSCSHAESVVAVVAVVAVSGMQRSFGPYQGRGRAGRG